MLRLNAGSGSKYRDGWINVDIDPMWKPDLICDLSQKVIGVPYQGEYDEIFAGDLLEHVPNLVQLMTNFLFLLKEGGKLEIHVPYDLSYGAWQDPTHVRAFNERSWMYYCEWYWYLGWKEYRFVTQLIYYEYSAFGTELTATKSVDEILRTPRAVDAMRVELIKIRV